MVLRRNWIKLHIEKIHNFYSLANILRILEGCLTVHLPHEII